MSASESQPQPAEQPDRRKPAFGVPSGAQPQFSAEAVLFSRRLPEETAQRIADAHHQQSLKKEMGLLILPAFFPEEASSFPEAPNDASSLYDEPEQA